MKELKAAIARTEKLIGRKQVLRKHMLVHKNSGYPFPGIVIDTFRNQAGKLMVNVESIMHPGMIHIFPAATMSIWNGDLHGLLDTYFAWLQNFYHIE